MLVGILFTVIVSLAIASFSFLAFVHYRNVQPQFASREMLAFSVFWLCMGVVWFLTAISDFFSYLHMREISIILTYTLQVFVGGSLLAAMYFLQGALLKGRGRSIFLTLYWILFCIFLLNLFGYGVHIRSDNFFANQITSPEEALVVFVLMFVPLWFFSFFLFFKSFFSSTLEKEKKHFYILASLSLIILGAAGSLDEIGIVSGAIVTASRLISLMSALIAYFSIMVLSEPKDLTI